VPVAPVPGSTVPLLRVSLPVAVWEEDPLLEEPPLDDEAPLDDEPPFAVEPPCVEEPPVCPDACDEAPAPPAWEAPPPALDDPPPFWASSAAEATNIARTIFFMVVVPFL